MDLRGFIKFFRLVASSGLSRSLSVEKPAESSVPIFPCGIILHSTVILSQPGNFSVFLFRHPGRSFRSVFQVLPICKYSASTFLGYSLSRTSIVINSHNDRK
ncbi:hypothetical protein RvY_15609-2 [Ramazzottius varieornatus]|uniref:Uncharacterized protein n=1 Tax=Ramazzottius varieornatus TaxID=947166 RepID=A0A1D1VWP4_RAMVA|nr:hypothetical protein RvY_15609-2 [Ramazzottius varieornatus]